MFRKPKLSALLFGVAAALGFAPYELWPLTVLALALWMLLIHRAPTLKSALWQGWAFGVGHFTINNNWFQHAFDFQDKMPPVLGYAAPVALALYLAVYPALAAGAAWQFRREKVDAGYVFAFAAAWIVTEWLRSVVFTGYAWDPLGVIWVPVEPVAATTAFIGTYALGGITMLGAGGLLLIVRPKWRIATFVSTMLVLLIARMFSYWPDYSPLPPATPRVIVAQPNVPQDERGESDGEMMLQKLAALSGKPGRAPRLIVWPEAAVRDYFEDGYPAYYYTSDPFWIRWRMAKLLGPRDMLLTGGTALQFDKAGNAITATNSIFTIDPRARIRGRYDKAHLVPYGEYLPMPWLLKPLGLDRLVPGSMDFAEGPGPRSMEVPGFGLIGMQICYEIIFSGQVVDPAKRPRLIFNPSTDAWFGKWGPPQHLAQARMRAIEEGLPIVRATPNGISAIIGADGRLIATVPHEKAGTAEAPIPPAFAPTLFSRLGNWLAGAVALLFTAVAVALRRRAR